MRRDWGGCVVVIVAVAVEGHGVALERLRYQRRSAFCQDPLLAAGAKECSQGRFWKPCCEQSRFMPHWQVFHLGSGGHLQSYAGHEVRVCEQTSCWSTGLEFGNPPFSLAMEYEQIL